uniref:Uncharacterized protein n=1 Tax=Sphaerodactylus townsendi TaxID=933632 RepID=A0ACB8FUI5_9SAUR
MEAGRVPLTEEDIRERVTLRPEELAHVRVLSLPGTYHEKITHLGSSLKKFIHLKHLDLSRNALTSLEMEHVFWFVSDRKGSLIDSSRGWGWDAKISAQLSGIPATAAALTVVATAIMGEAAHSRTALSNNSHRNFIDEGTGSSE